MQDVFDLITPFAFLGGLGLALARNSYAVMRLNVSKEGGAVVSTVRLRIKFLISRWSLRVLAIGYIGWIRFLENFAHR